MISRKALKRALAGTTLSLAVVLALYLKSNANRANSLVSSGVAQVAALIKPPAPETNVAFCQDFYRATCQKGGEGHDPTGAVKPDVIGEIRALRAYEEIIHEHRDWNPSQVDGELVKRIYTPERVKRIQWAFRRAKLLVIELLDRQPPGVFTHHEKATLKDRIKRTVLELPPATDYSDEPDLFTKNDVYYERTADGHLRMRVGGAYLIAAKSRFNELFTVAHELAHSIDPCEMKAANVHLQAYERVSACFLRTGLVAQSSGRLECGENDQLAETFADWIATQALAESLKNFATEFHGSQLSSAAANSVRDLCEQDEGSMELDTSQHPSPKTRINGIFGNNPEIRGLGCEPASGIPENQKYCSFESQEPETATRVLSGAPSTSVNSLNPVNPVQGEK